MRTLRSTVVVVATILAGAQATAQRYDPHYPGCLQKWGESGFTAVDCSYTSLEQCDVLRQPILAASKSGVAGPRRPGRRRVREFFPMRAGALAAGASVRGTGEARVPLGHKRSGEKARALPKTSYRPLIVAEVLEMSPGVGSADFFGDGPGAVRCLQTALEAPPALSAAIVIAGRASRTLQGALQG
jgi:hypothetical protein